MRKSYHKEFGVEIISDILASKQDKLVSGTNIKTVNNQSILGSGNIEIQSGGLEVVSVLPTPTQEIWNTKKLYLQESDYTLYYCILENSEYKWSSTKGLNIFDSDIDPFEFWNFGVSGLTNSNPQLTRTNDAVGKGWEYVGEVYNSVIKTDFDDFFNFERIIDSSGNVFIRIPKMYRKFTEDTINVANYKVDDSYVVYSCFQNEKNGEEKDYIDIGAYKGSLVGSRLTSRSGVAYTGNKTIYEFRTYARANNELGYTYQQQDIHVLMLLWDLFQIVFATRKTEDVIGTSWKKYDRLKRCGDTNTLVDNSLTYPLSICGKNSDFGGFKFFGIEDIVGYAYEFIDGILFDYTKIYVGYNPSEYDTSTRNKELLSYYRPGSGYISKLGIDPFNPCINYPTQGGGTKDTYYTDNCYYSSFSSPGTIIYQGADNFNDALGLFQCGGSEMGNYNNVG